MLSLSNSWLVFLTHHVQSFLGSFFLGQVLKQKPRKKVKVNNPLVENITAKLPTLVMHTPCQPQDLQQMGEIKLRKVSGWE